MLGQFNLFEALGAVHVEVRHSDFLSFLLTPSESHGLDDIFVKRLLQKALLMSSGQALPISLIDLDTWDLDELVVWREWQNIDILLLDHRNQLAVIIENKVHSTEHSQQLQRYWQIISQHYSMWRIVGLFLSPEGDPPSDDNYIPISYSSICEILENLSKTRASALNSDVRVALNHYTQMLRRHIMSEF
ncbi:MAG: PD-(D/E)XK nuclease family protein [Anaerolineales bacterium]